jgi:hypothetical protein
LHQEWCSANEPADRDEAVLGADAEFKVGVRHALGVGHLELAFVITLADDSNGGHPPAPGPGSSAGSPLGAAGRAPRWGPRPVLAFGQLFDEPALGVAEPPRKVAESVDQFYGSLGCIVERVGVHFDGERELSRLAFLPRAVVRRAVLLQSLGEPPDRIGIGLRIDVEPIRDEIPSHARESTELASRQLYESAREPR